MFDRQLTDKRVAESVMRTLNLEVSFEPAFTAENGQREVEFTIFSLDPLSGRPFIFGRGVESEIWTKIRELVEEYEKQT